MEGFILPFTVPEHHVLEFSTEVNLLSQQMESKVYPIVDVKTFYGEGAEAVKQYGTTDFGDLTDPTGDTAFDTINKDSRWVFPADKKNALPVTREDELRMISDPRGPLVMAQGAALGRLYDDIMFAAAVGSNQTGKYDSLTPTPVPASQTVNDPFGAPAAPFSLAFVKEAKKILDDNDVPAMDRHIIVSPDMIRRLLDDPEVTSADFNTVKALVNGEINTFLGFTWTTSTRLPGTGTIQQAIAYHRSGLCLGIWNKDGNMVYSRVDERPDKNYTWQVYSKVTLGATRTEEAKVVIIGHDTAL